MKTNIYKLFCIILCLGFVSCSDWLDKLPENTLPTSDIDFTKIDNMYAPVSGVYALARKDLTRWEVFLMLNVRGDDATKGGGSDNDQYTYLDVERFNYDEVKGFWALNNSWNAYYKVIFATYQNMDLLNKYRENIISESDFDKADTYEAEIRFWRAYSYFMLNNIFGEVPIVDPADLFKVKVPRNKVEAVRAFIHSELDYCIANLPALRPNERTDFVGAVTKYTAMTLKSKVALYEGNHTLVETLTDDIIGQGGFDLFPDFYQLFKIPGKLSNESILEYQFTDFGTSSGDHVYAGAWYQHQGPRGGAAPIAGWGFDVPEEGFGEFMKARGEDVRFKGALLVSGETTPSGDDIPANDRLKYYNGKAYTPSDQYTEERTQYGENNNIRVLRYADVLLMNAEAKIRNGKSGDESLKLVRERAGLEAINAATLEDVLNERRAEMSQEWGDRFFDLIRTDKASSVLEGFIKGKHEYLPIPLAQEDLNPLLKDPAI